VPATSTLAAMEQRARVLGPALFMPQAVMENVRRLVRGPTSGSDASNFSCAPKPDTLRVPWQHDWLTTFDGFDLNNGFTDKA
jgi:hypothetical protein